MSAGWWWVFGGGWWWWMVVVVLVWNNGGRNRGRNAIHRPYTGRTGTYLQEPEEEAESSLPAVQGWQVVST